LNAHRPKGAVSLILALSLVTWANTPVHAQAVADGRRLQLGADSLYVYRIVRGDTIATGQIVDRLEAVTVDGEPRIRRIYVTADAGMGAEVDSIEDVVAGLAPRRLRVRQRNRDILVRFTGDSAIGYSKAPMQASEPVQAALAPGVINGFSFDLYLRSADLALGRRFDLTVYDASARTLTPTSAEVVAEEVVAGVPSWHLRGTFGEMPVEFWVAKDGRRLRRQLIYPVPGIGILFVTEPVRRP
jgi:hypothetical protein